ncbi:MAG: MinD/ParA family protein [Thermodesulfobacteriota bacterium]|nr:MinD/ParA family protein [Thermodesulfobacteriota bacterium]
MTNSPKIICVSSGKGGVGKTSFSVNMACSLARQKQKVLLVDGDLGLANVDVLLGLNVRHTLQETIDEERPLSSILVEIEPGFKVLPASSGVPEMANISYEEQAFLINALENIIDNFDYVLVDSAAGIGDAVLWFNNWADNNIIILSPDPTAMTDAYALIKVLFHRFGKNQFHLLINNVKSKKEGRQVFNNMENVLKKFLQISPDYLGSMPQDSAVVRAIRSQKPFLEISPDSRVSRAVMEISSQILSM